MPHTLFRGFVRLNENKAQGIVYDLLKDELDDESDKHWITNRGISIEISVKFRTIFIQVNPDIDCDVLMRGIRKYMPIHIRNIDEQDVVAVYRDSEQ